MSAATTIKTLVNKTRCTVTCKVIRVAIKKYGEGKEMAIVTLQDDTGQIDMIGFDDTAPLLKTMLSDTCYAISNVDVDVYNNVMRLKANATTTVSEVAMCIKGFVSTVSHVKNNLADESRTSITGVLIGCEKNASQSKSGTDRLVATIADEHNEMRLFNYKDAVGFKFQIGQTYTFANSKKVSSTLICNYDVPTVEANNTFSVDTLLSNIFQTPHTLSELFPLDGDRVHVNVVGIVQSVEAVGEEKKVLFVGDRSAKVKATVYANVDFEVGQVVAFYNAKLVSLQGGDAMLQVWEHVWLNCESIDFKSWWNDGGKNADVPLVDTKASDAKTAGATADASSVDAKASADANTADVPSVDVTSDAHDVHADAA